LLYTLYGIRVTDSAVFFVVDLSPLLTLYKLYCLYLTCREYNNFDDDDDDDDGERR